MNLRHLIARLLGLDETVESFDHFSLTFVESWARQRPAVLALAIAFAVATACFFYFKAQRKGSPLTPPVRGPWSPVRDAPSLQRGGT